MPNHREAAVRLNHQAKRIQGLTIERYPVSFLFVHDSPLVYQLLMRSQRKMVSAFDQCSYPFGVVIYATKD